MNEDNAHSLKSLVQALESTLEQIQLSRAAELARSGRFLEAESLLSPLGRIPTAAAALDLLARIAAQQHRFERAAGLWEAALQVEPDNNAFKRALEKTHSRQQTPAWLLRLPKIVLSAAIAAFVALVSWTLAVTWTAEQPAVNPTPLPTRKAMTIPDKPAPAPTLAQRVPSFNLPGIRESSDSVSLALQFEQSPFISGEKLRPASKRLLKQIADGLASIPDPFRIEVAVHGPDRKRTDKGNLGGWRAEFARALVIVDILQSRANLPIGRFSARVGAPDDQPPGTLGPVEFPLIIRISPMERR